VVIVVPTITMPGRTGNRGQPASARRLLAEAEAMDAHRDELGGYSTSKGTIHFEPAQPLPMALVTKLVKARMAETDGEGVTDG
jgi:uncharacterized protein YdhG (YjbR/CyaY superfamily)